MDPLRRVAPELGLDDLHVADGVDVSLNVDDIGVVESTYATSKTISFAGLATDAGTVDSRTTWKIPSTARTLLKKLFPSPAPDAAPLVSPAMSTQVRKAGILLEGL